MLLSLAFIFITGMLFAALMEKLKMPKLLGMLLTGIILGPYGLNLLDSSILSISPDLRQLALIIILTRAGLNLNVNELYKAGRPALLMCFLPACFEIFGIVLLAPMFFKNITMLDAAIIGSVIAAVSPAVIVPKMIMLIDSKCGTDKLIPQIIMAGASVDDIFVIVLFTAFTGLASGGTLNVKSFLNIPVSIISGAIIGFLCGYLMVKLFKYIHIRDSAKVIIILSISFILVALEKYISPYLAFSGLLAVMCMGISINKMYTPLSKRLSLKFSKLWVGAEVLLFALVGATVNISFAFSYGINAVIVLLGALIFRMAGVAACMLGTNLNGKERLFCMIAYMPKATVQAAIGSIPLAMGLSCGNLVLTIAVISILITAPLGAFLIDNTYRKFLKRS